MSSAAKKILEDAMALADEEREELAAHLLGSLPATGEQEIEAEWMAEVRRRMADVDAGKVSMIPWEEARQVLRERLKHGKTPPNPSSSP